MARAVAERGPEHGVRRTYKFGCRCVPCRSAESAYRANLRRRHATGAPILGSPVPAGSTRRRLRALQIEGYSERALARLTGRGGRVRLQRARVTLATALRVSRVHRRVMHECLTP